MSIYTKNGDDGTTSLSNGERIRKDSVLIDVYGTIDELNSHLGVLSSLLDVGHDKDFVEQVQNNLFVIGTYISSGCNEHEPLALSSELAEMEKEIDTISANLPQLNNFILPGGSTDASYAHVCRTVCRRVERLIVGLSENMTISNDVLSYMNRLSDYLFVFARKMNFLHGDSEKKWKKTCR